MLFDRKKSESKKKEESTLSLKIAKENENDFGRLIVRMARSTMARLGGICWRCCSVDK